MSVRHAFIDCHQNGIVIASYPIGIPITALPSAPLDMKKLEEEAKSQLTTDQIAFPPYEGITCQIRYAK